MTYFVCDLLDLEGHGRALAGGDRDSDDLIAAALNDYEKQGMTLQHVVPPAINDGGERVGRAKYPKFIFHKETETPVRLLN